MTADERTDPFIEQLVQRLEEAALEVGPPERGPTASVAGSSATQRRIRWILGGAGMAAAVIVAVALIAADRGQNREAITGTRAGEPDTAGLERGEVRLLPEAPIEPRFGAAAAWADGRALVWGGLADDGPQRADGAVYDARKNEWQLMADSPLSPRVFAQSVWTGSELVVAGGMAEDSTLLADVAAYDPEADSWRELPDIPYGPSAAGAAVWTGSEMVISGGQFAPADTAEVGPGSQAGDPVTRLPVDEVPLAALDPGTGAWRELPPIRGIAGRAAEAVWFDGTLVTARQDGRDEEPWGRPVAIDVSTGDARLLPDAGPAFGRPAVADDDLWWVALDGGGDEQVDLLRLGEGGEAWESIGRPRTPDFGTDFRILWTGETWAVFDRGGFWTLDSTMQWRRTRGSNWNLDGDDVTLAGGGLAFGWGSAAPSGPHGDQVGVLVRPDLRMVEPVAPSPGEAFMGSSEALIVTAVDGVPIEGGIYFRLAGDEVVASACVWSAGYRAEVTGDVLSVDHEGGVWADLDCGPPPASEAEPARRILAEPFEWSVRGVARVLVAEDGTEFTLQPQVTLDHLVGSWAPEDLLSAGAESQPVIVFGRPADEWAAEIKIDACGTSIESRLWNVSRFANGPSDRLGLLECPGAQELASRIGAGTEIRVAGEDGLEFFDGETAVTFRRVAE